MHLDCLPKDIIYEICRYIYKNKDIKSICNFNMANSHLSRKVTNFMVHNCVYNCDKMIKDIHKRNLFDYYEKNHLKYIKNVKVCDLKYLKYYENKLRYMIYSSDEANPKLYLKAKDVEELIIDASRWQQISYFQSNNLKKLTLSNRMSIINFDCQNLLELSTESYFNQLIGHFKCEKLQKLSFGVWFNQPIENLNCPNLLELSFGKYFNQSIENLNCSNLQKLSFGALFNRPIENIKLPNLQKLSFGALFNQPIENIKLPNLQKLSFGKYFNQPIENIKLPNLQKLSFGAHFNQPIENLNSPNLLELSFGEYFNQPINNFNFPNLKKCYVHIDDWKYIKNINFPKSMNLCINYYYRELYNKKRCNKIINKIKKIYPNNEIMIHTY